MSSAFDIRALRDAFGTFMTGVTVVTSTDNHDKPLGFTANSFSSVSLAPPLLLVCVAKSTGSYAHLCQAHHFAVNILAEDQKTISNTFASPCADRFAGIAWQTSACGSPLLEGSAAWFDCMTHQRIDAGDHMILLGEIKSLGNSGKPGLGYSRGAYFTPSQTEHRLLEKTAHTVSVALVAERGHEVLLVPTPDDGWTLPSLTKAGDETIAHMQARFTADLGLPVQMGLLYSIYDHTTSHQQHLVYRAVLNEGPVQNSGRLFAIAQLPLAKIKDSAVRETLKRYSQESVLGNFGLYFGNQVTGQVHAVQGHT